MSAFCRPWSDIRGVPRGTFHNASASVMGVSLLLYDGDSWVQLGGNATYLFQINCLEFVSNVARANRSCCL